MHITCKIDTRPHQDVAELSALECRRDCHLRKLEIIAGHRDHRHGACRFAPNHGKEYLAAGLDYKLRMVKLFAVMGLNGVILCYPLVVQVRKAPGQRRVVFYYADLFVIPNRRTNLP